MSGGAGVWSGLRLAGRVILDLSLIACSEWTPRPDSGHCCWGDDGSHPRRPQHAHHEPIALAAVAGVGWGILGGALPGISPSISMALLLPFTYGLEPNSAIVLLASTYIGAEYGGSIPAILINTPGTNAAAATLLDGYPMKLAGRGGEALGISLYSGVIGGFFGLLMLVLLTRPLANLALAFTPMSYFALGVLGLSVIAVVSGSVPVEGSGCGCTGFDGSNRRIGSDLGCATIHVRPAGAARRHRADPCDGRTVCRQ